MPDNDINTFWTQGIFDDFIGVDNAKVKFAAFLQNEKEISKPIVISPGRVESYLKYQELIFDLYQQGYSVFIIDHRGQGLSDRLLPDPHKGYVHKFQDYIDDFSYFIKYIISDYSAEKPFLLAHSMGAAIATRYMQDFPQSIKASVLFSPMFDINTGGIPTSIAKLLVNTKLKINQIFSDAPWYFFGQNPYTAKPFHNNKLSHCDKRYQDFIELYVANQALQLGGVTTHWLKEALSVKKEIFKDINHLKTPTLLLQAELDGIVSLKAQNTFCQKLHVLQPQSCPDGKPIIIKGAYHEILFETDDIRQPALGKTLEWFTQHQH